MTKLSDVYNGSTGIENMDLQIIKKRSLNEYKIKSVHKLFDSYDEKEAYYYLYVHRYRFKRT